MTKGHRLGVTAVSILLVAPLMAVALVGIIVVPSWVDVEIFCLLERGVARLRRLRGGLRVDHHLFSGVALLVLMAVFVRRVRWRIVLPPLVWLGAILVAELLVALAISPQPCGGSIGL